MDGADVAGLAENLGVGMKIAVIANSAWYLHNFRRPLMSMLASEGYSVVALSPHDAWADRLREQGFQWEPWTLAPSGTAPWTELQAVRSLRRLLRERSIGLAFTYTPKANIYTGLAARGLALRHVPNVSGLGSGFLRRGPLAMLMTGLYRLAFARAGAVVFQNEDDRQVFLRAGLVDAARTVRVPGSGVDLQRFAPAAWPSSEPTVFLFIGRILRDKGAREFAQAAALLRAQGVKAQFRMLGSWQADNPTVIPAHEWQAWQDSGLVDILGSAEDVRPHIAAAHCVVLPSYREGLPRALLEAAAMERPCVATDVPGCRDVVLHGQTGLLCAARDGAALASTLHAFLDLGIDQWRHFGAAGRLHVERHFGEERVLETYRGLICG